MQQNAVSKDQPVFYFIEEADLSLDNGPGVNEREFVSKLLVCFSDNVVCFAPRPMKQGGRLYEGVHYVTGHRKHHPLFYLLYQLHLLWAVCITAYHKKPTAIVTRPDIFPIVPLVASTLFRVPLFLKTVGIGSHERLRERFPTLGRYVLSPCADAVWNLLIKRAQLIEVTTAEFIDVLCQIFKGADRSRFVVIPNGANTELFRPLDQHRAQLDLGLTGFSHLVGYTGTLRWYSGIEELINASPYVLERYSNVGFVIVGHGPHEERQRQLAKVKGVEDNFLFVGHKPYEQMPIYVNAFDVSTFLLPTSRMEQIGPTSMKIRQYLACGNPVVATVGHDFIQEKGLGWLVVPEDAKQVADAVCKGLRLDEAERKCIGDRARQYSVDEFSYDRLVRKRYELWAKGLEKLR